MMDDYIGLLVFVVLMLGVLVLLSNQHKKDRELQPLSEETENQNNY